MGPLLGGNRRRCRLLGKCFPSSRIMLLMQRDQLVVGGNGVPERNWKRIRGRLCSGVRAKSIWRLVRVLIGCHGEHPSLCIMDGLGVEHPRRVILLPLSIPQRELDVLLMVQWEGVALRAGRSGDGSSSHLQEGLDGS